MTLVPKICCRFNENHVRFYENIINYSNITFFIASLLDSRISFSSKYYRYKSIFWVFFLNDTTKVFIWLQEHKLMGTKQQHEDISLHTNMV